MHIQWPQEHQESCTKKKGKNIFNEIFLNSRVYKLLLKSLHEITYHTKFEGPRFYVWRLYANRLR